MPESGQVFDDKDYWVMEDEKEVEPKEEGDGLLMEEKTTPGTPILA